uniref:Uncharacterized protein n=1 Tax=Coprothermobacter proteolyticus (strain ATCC 35245 / DSM 5265 / OCM 4 / BT) TaxID=309798 RepID=B5Y657_COPPD
MKMPEAVIKIPLNALLLVANLFTLKLYGVNKKKSEKA